MEYSKFSDKNNTGSSVNGYVFAVLAAGFWAMSGTLSKSLFNDGVTPFQLVQLRTTIAAAALFSWFIINARDMLVIRRTDVLHFILLGAVLAVSQVTYLYAISKIQVASAILLQYQAPVFIAAYMFVFAKKKMPALTIFSIAVAVTGCFLVAGAYNQDILNLSRAGIISGLLSAIAFGMYSVISDAVMKKYHPLTVVFYAFLFAAVFWNILQQPFSAFAVAYGQTGWLKIIAIGVLGTVVPFVLYNYGIRKIGATHTAVAATMEPVFAGIISYAFLGETLRAPQLLGAGMIIAAVVLLQITRNR
jgi:drug/metabolite transporter (DMT)-like permease